MSHPNPDEVSIDDYDAGDYDDGPQEYDPRRADHRRNQAAPADLAPINSGGYDEPAIKLSDPGPKLSGTQRAGNRAQRRAAAREHEPSDDFPIEREANGIVVVAVPYDGETYWVPTDPAEWDARATRAFEDGKAITALEYILEPGEPTGVPGERGYKPGKPGYELLMSKNYRMRQINELFELIAKAGGFDSAGN